MARRRRVRRGWSELPDDLLDRVYLAGSCSSPCDSARFAAVCKSWRAVASWHPAPPAIPLLVPSTGNAKRDRKARAYCLEDGRVLRAPLGRSFPWGKRLVGSHDGGWIAAAAGTRLLVVNPFSGAQLKLSANQSNIACRCPTKSASKPRIIKGKTSDETFIRKIVFSEDPSSTGCTMAAITTGCKIAVCKLDCPPNDDGWMTQGCGTQLCQDFADIAFCNGTLYGIMSNDLLRFDIGAGLEEEEHHHAPVVVTSLIDIPRSMLSGAGPQSSKYIFHLRGKVAIAVKFTVVRYSCRAQFFRVFELDKDTTPPYQYTWVEVTDLGDHALFLGPAFCKAVPVSATRGEVVRNRIYYSEQHLNPRDNVERLKRLDLGSYTVYHGKSTGEIYLERIKSHGYHYRHEDGSNGCIWLLPPNL